MLFNTPGIAGENTDRFSGSKVPKPDGSIAAACCQILAVRGKVGAPYIRLMTSQLARRQLKGCQVSQYGIAGGRVIHVQRAYREQCDQVCVTLSEHQVVGFRGQAFCLRAIETDIRPDSQRAPLLRAAMIARVRTAER